MQLKLSKKSREALTILSILDRRPFATILFAHMTLAINLLVNLQDKLFSEETRKKYHFVFDDLTNYLLLSVTLPRATGKPEVSSILEHPSIIEDISILAITICGSLPMNEQLALTRTILEMNPYELDEAMKNGPAAELLEIEEATYLTAKIRPDLRDTVEEAMRITGEEKPEDAYADLEDFKQRALSSIDAFERACQRLADEEQMLYPEVYVDKPHLMMLDPMFVGKNLNFLIENLPTVVDTIDVASESNNSMASLLGAMMSNSGMDMEEMMKGMEEMMSPEPDEVGSEDYMQTAIKEMQNKISVEERETRKSWIHSAAKMMVPTLAMTRDELMTALEEEGENCDGCVGMQFCVTGESMLYRQLLDILEISAEESKITLEEFNAYGEECIDSLRFAAATSLSDIQTMVEGRAEELEAEANKAANEAQDLLNK